MPSEATQSRHVFRGILRMLKPRNDRGGIDTRRPTQMYTIKQFRASYPGHNVERSEQMKQLALEYLTLHRDIAERSRLYQLDSGAEEQLSPKELSRRAAARAGLQLPRLNPDLD